MKLTPICTHMAFTLLLIYSLKKFLNKPNYNFKKNAQSFSHSLISKISKFTIPNLRLKFILQNYSL